MKALLRDKTLVRNMTTCDKKVLDILTITLRARDIFIEQPSPEPKIKALIPTYEPLEVTKCETCGKVIAEPKELILQN